MRRSWRGDRWCDLLRGSNRHNVSLKTIGMDLDVGLSGGSKDNCWSVKTL